MSRIVSRIICSYLVFMIMSIGLMANEQVNELMDAIYANNIPLIENIIKQGTDVNCQDEFGFTPLMRAIDNNYINIEVIEVLLKNGANDKKVNNFGESASSILVKKDDSSKSIKKLFDQYLEWTDEGINMVTKNKYNKDGYNRAGYDKDGFDRSGYDQNGYNREHFNKDGYNKDTETKFNKMGYDKDGYNKDGYNKDGYDYLGFDKYGYNAEGYNNMGYNKAGYDKNGYNNTGYDKSGYDVDGYNKNGFNKYGLNKYGFNKSTKPKALYLLAGKHERAGENEKASATYQYIVDNYPDDDLAIKASDALLRVGTVADASKGSNNSSNNSNAGSEWVGKEVQFNEIITFTDDAGNMAAAMFGGFKYPFTFSYTAVVEQELGDSLKIIIKNGTYTGKTGAANRSQLLNAANNTVANNVGKTRVVNKNDVVKP